MVEWSLGKGMAQLIEKTSRIFFNGVAINHGHDAMYGGRLNYLNPFPTKGILSRTSG